MTLFTMLSVGGCGDIGALEAAEIAEAGEPEREELAVLVEREFGGLLVVAAVVVGDEARRSARRSISPVGRATSAACRMQTYSG